MKRNCYLFFLSFVLLGCRNVAYEYEVDEPKTALESSRLLRFRFAQAVQGTPLEVPLLEESDSTVFVMPVSDDKENIKIDRFYLVDYTNRNAFSFEDDIYLINRIEKIKASDDTTIKYVAVVTSIRNNSEHRYDLEWFDFQKMWRWKCPYTVKVPVVTVLNQSHQSE